MSRLRAGALAALLLAVSACVSRPQPPVPQSPIPAPLPPPQPLPPPPPNALQAGVELATSQPMSPERADRVLSAFRISCPKLVIRKDQSGLTRPQDWVALCERAAQIPPASAAQFFASEFEWVQVGPGAAFATGYFEPEIAASRTRQPGYEVPIYRKPPDLVRGVRPDGTTGRGRVDPLGQLVPYFSRAEIEDGALAGRGLEVAWAADPIALFFLEVQGSGRLRLPDGQVMRIGYADQNGLPYVAVGRLLRERQLLQPGGATMKGIIAWMRAQPDRGRALMRENPSYVFFRELIGPGPLGALDVPVTAQATVAADPLFVPLGAPVWVALDRPEASGLWVAQDTGGAIKGANRFDTFWGAGEAAAAIAGGMSASGKALILLPKGTVARARAQ